MKQYRNLVGSRLAASLNRDCQCIAVDKAELHKSLEEHLKGAGLSDRLVDPHTHLFAESPVFLWHGHVEEMQELVSAVDRVTRDDSFRATVLAAAPASARRNFGPRGTFFGYDFHLGAEGPQLIEINTNAGGVLLNVYLAAAQQACCSEVITYFGGSTDIANAENAVVSMFKEEWQLQRPDTPLQTIAIVDTEPTTQFLYAEFVLFQSLFERHGIHAVVADPKDFTIRGNTLSVAGQNIDLVYNRLTDFYLQAPESACLLEAYQRGLTVLTPSPYHYALYADKRNLALLSDADRLRKLGIDQDAIDTLSRSLPKTMLVTDQNADELWQNRRQLFFKPCTGFGSRGAYRGAKLTRRVWNDIVQSDYVAQAIVPPSERQLIVDGEQRSLKLDVRCVTYNARIQQLSARLYRGQTTNLRSEGGGLATVFSTPQGI